MNQPELEVPKKTVVDTQFLLKTADYLGEHKYREVSIYIDGIKNFVAQQARVEQQEKMSQQISAKKAVETEKEAQVVVAKAKIAAVPKEKVK